MPHLNTTLFEMPLFMFKLGKCQLVSHCLNTVRTQILLRIFIDWKSTMQTLRRYMENGSNKIKSLLSNEKMITGFLGGIIFVSKWNLIAILSWMACTTLAQIVSSIVSRQQRGMPRQRNSSTIIDKVTNSAFFIRMQCHFPTLQLLR